MKKKVSLPKTRVLREFETFNITPRSKSRLKFIIEKNSKLKSAINAVFNKKVFIAGGVVTALALGTQSINNYIYENSGCFLYENNNVLCKIKELSCWSENDPLQIEIPFCKELNNIPTNACEGVDDFCASCDCDTVGCEENQTVECRKATVGEALSHFVSTTSDYVSDKIMSFPLVKPLIAGVVIVFIILILWRLL